MLTIRARNIANVIVIIKGAGLNPELMEQERQLGPEPSDADTPLLVGAEELLPTHRRRARRALRCVDTCMGCVWAATQPIHSPSKHTGGAGGGGSVI